MGCEGGKYLLYDEVEMGWSFYSTVLSQCEMCKVWDDK